ncbi:serine/threonine-protein kinase Chk1-like [Dysidea avara]|uniref:serine/threonine-protein kinase Chk1-like n=1 Tax=Dysidea avara TaxID=196820 RepID=UPI00332694CC
MEFVEGWDFMQTLGEGAYGEVKLAVNRSNGECVAVKIIRSADHPDFDPNNLKKEICVMKLLRHENIVRFFGQRTEGNICYLFLEYASGGELFDRIEPDKGMVPGMAHHFFVQLLNGMEYLHSRGVVHRDIKPENLLLDSNDVLKISDFGLSTVFRYRGDERKLSKSCGTIPYIAPEVYAGIEHHAQPADLWSCGITLVALLSGELPWDKPSKDNQEYQQWSVHNFFISPWNKISNEPLALLKKMLRISPAKRYTIEQIKKHIWYKKKYAHLPLSEDAVPSPRYPTKSMKIESSPRYRERTGNDRTVTSSQPLILDNGDVSLTAADNNCFTQPSCYDELVVGTQISCTPAGSNSQAPFQRLAMRMTRFHTKLEPSVVWSKLNAMLKKLSYDPKPSPDLTSISVATEDRRGYPLGIRISLFQLQPGNLLVDFRRSKGDGIEFKRVFKKIRENLSDIICKPPSVTVDTGTVLSVHT